MNRRVTLEDIAREAGLSVAAASRALNGSTRVSEATRQRVVAVSERLGYQRRRGPRRRGGAGPRLALLLLESRSSARVVDRYIAAISRLVKVHGGRVEVGELADRTLNQCEAELRHHVRGVDGLLVFGYVSAAFADLLAEVRVPAVVIGDAAPMATPPAYLVHADAMGATMVATRALLDAGHHRIGLFCKSFPPGGWRDQWLSGYRAALRHARDAGDPQLCQVIDAHTDHDVGVEAAHQFLALPDPPTAYLAPQFGPALGFRTVMAERGVILKPRQLVLGGDLDDIANHGFADHPLITEDADAAAAHAMHLLQRLIGDERVPPVRLGIPCAMRNFTDLAVS